MTRPGNADEPTSKLSKASDVARRRPNPGAVDLFTTVFDTAPTGKPSAGVTKSSDEDVWTTLTTAEYNPDEFYVRSTNKHDHRTQQRVAFPPAIQAALQEVVRGGQWPVYRNAHDFVRDAVVHRLHYLKARGWENPIVEELLKIERAQGVLETARMLDEQREELLQDAVDTIARLRKSGDSQKLIEVLLGLDDIADGLGAPWDQKMRALVTANFPPGYDHDSASIGGQ